MTREVALAEAKNQLSALVQEVEDTGSEIVITKHGRPAAKLSRAQRRSRTAEERQTFAADMQTIRDAQAAANPEAAKPIPWEALKKWMYEDEDDHSA